MMNKFLSDVEEFNKKFDLDKHHLPEPGFNSPDLLLFRVKFMMEELQEFSNACGIVITGDKVHYDPNARKDLEKALDGLVDLLYVLKGTALFMGLGSVFDEAWQRVQDANMKKVRVVRTEDSKRKSGFDVIKPAGWTQPTFGDLLYKKKIDITK
jgi:predicted HAD superfamily Cof-like phosphohydrolase